MFTVEILLPLDTRAGAPIEYETIEGIVAGLADRFGGATAFTRAPAEGLWKQPSAIKRDRIIIVEVTVKDVDAGWWCDYRDRLERALDQDEIFIRATECRRI